LASSTLDEVITGFGRLGTWTGAEYFGVTPDILNFAKQVTNLNVVNSSLAVQYNPPNQK
jgi:adenosylmethionine-8-amino-7-oxononanoate aminotransferase